MQRYWQELSIIINASEADRISAIMENLGATAIRYEGVDDQLLVHDLLAESVLWDKTKLIAQFASNVDIKNVVTVLTKEVPSYNKHKYEISKIEEQDWVRLTQEQFEPILIADRLWICPSNNKVDTDKIVLELNPGLAFGTGRHPTTQLCLQWLCEQELKNKYLIDYGCGSGVLAIGALLLGAYHVTAIDHDTQAVLATKENVQLNSVDFESQISVQLDTAMIEYKAPIIIANILARPLCDLIAVFTEYLEEDGLLVMSGILEEQAPMIHAVFKQHFTHIETRQQEEWILMVWLKKNDAKC